MKIGRYRRLATALLGAALLAGATAAGAQSYNFTYTGTTGTVLATGTITTDGNTYDASSFTGRAGATGSAVTGVTGSFLGQSLTYTPPPHPGQTVTNGFAIADDLLLDGTGTRLDEYGLALGTNGALGLGNLLGYNDPDESQSGGQYLWLFQHGVRGGYEGTLSLTAATGTTTTTPGGTMADPTGLPSGQISAISGAIGPGALEQFYSFQWGGGAFGTQASVTDAAPADLFTLYLLGTGTTQSAVLNQANGFIGALDVTNLAAGTYTIGLAANVNVDPDFTIRFDNAIGTAAPMPEAATWMMMIAGFGLAGAALRRQRVALAFG